MVRRTLWPRGVTPVLPVAAKRDRISAISCITLSPQWYLPGLYFELLPTNANVNAERVVAFLRAPDYGITGLWSLSVGLIIALMLGTTEGRNFGALRVRRGTVEDVMNRDVIQIPPTITIREGQRIKIYFTQDMLLPAYENHTIPQTF